MHPVYVCALPACVYPPVCPSVQILTPRKLFVLASKVSVFPSNAISLQEASPRYDDAKGTIHLDVSGAHALCGMGGGAEPAYGAVTGCHGLLRQLHSAGFGAVLVVVTSRGALWCQVR